MSGALIKPYEISIWQDALSTSKNGTSYYKEGKVAIIGSDKMSAPNRVFDPILTENLNGEITLTFSLVYKYVDPGTGEDTVNPFVPYLINERKVKLFYDDKWYDFVIKECDESSEENVFIYTAYNQFALELGKVGYNLTFNTELNNNQGTITKLAEKVLESTDWEVDKENSDLLRQTIKEPIYKCTVGSDITVLNVDTNEEVVVSANEIIYVFYSYLTNLDEKHVQFIRDADKQVRTIGQQGEVVPVEFNVDSDNVIISTNYRFLDDVEYELDEDGEVTEIRYGDVTISIDELYNENQAYRCVYSQRVVYDPIMKRTVDLYQAKYYDGSRDIYHYKDYEYATSELVTSYITNGSDFNIFDNGTIQGWSAATPTTAKQGGVSKLSHIALTTYPEINSANVLSRISNFSQIRGFMELKFPGVYTEGKNTFYNSGFEDSVPQINHIAAGQKFVLRMRYATATQKHGDLTPYTNVTNGKGLRAMVAKYEVVKEDFVNEKGVTESLYSYKPLTRDVLIDFDGDFTPLNNYITEGTFINGYQDYVIEDVIQTPSSAYIYKEGDNGAEYIWDATNQIFIPKNNSFFNYYMTIGEVNYSVTNTSLTDGTAKFGIFLYTDDSTLASRYIYVEDIQLTKYIEDGNGNPITIGNIPTGTSIETDYFYLKPTDRMTAADINVYSSLEFLAYETGLNVNTIVPVYNENCEKVLSFEEAQSNCFNILQTLCETFECWLKLKVLHNSDGSLWVDEGGRPRKTVVFKEFIGKENFAGFKYGLNLNSINRNIDSNEFVTKLIVDTVSNQYVDEGTLSIQNATSNPSNESYILNFNYYLNRGLIADKENFNKDLNQFYVDIKDVNKQLFELEKEKIDLEMALTKLRANRSVYVELIEQAKIEYTKALENFEKVAGINYFTYVDKQNTQQVANLVDNETIVELVGDIYTYSSVIDSNSGLLTTLDTEYNKIKLQLEGAREYGISITTSPAIISEGVEIPAQAQVVFDDYIEGVDFTLHSSSEVVSFTTSINERIFTVLASNSEGLPFTYFQLVSVPENYRVEYYENNQGYIIEKPNNVLLKIYDDATNKTLTRRLTLIPTEEYESLSTGIYKKIEQVREAKENIEKAFYSKYSRFIQEGTWSSQNYIDPELYYLDAVQVSSVSAQPKVSYTITVSEISEIEEFETYKFEVGDKTYIEDGDFFGYIETLYGNKVYTTPIKEEIIISEAKWYLDEPERNVITVQNYKTQFEDLFQRISASVQTLQYNEATYPKTSAILGTNGLIDRELLQKSWNAAGGQGYNLTSTGAITTDEEGIIVQDLTNSANLVKIVSRGIKTSVDGGETWLNVIDAYGVNAESINAGVLNTQQIWLMDGDNPSFRWDKAGISAFDFSRNEDEPYDLKTYVRFDKYGLYGIKDGENYIASSLQDIKDTAKFGLTWDGFFIKNSYTDGYVSISSEDDFQVVSTNLTKEIYVEPRQVRTEEFQAVDGVIETPYDNIQVLGVKLNITGTAIVGETTVVEEEDPESDPPQPTIGGEVEDSGYTVENRYITITGEKPDSRLGPFYEVQYILPLDSFDIGGDGIIKINKLEVNGIEYTEEQYSYNEETGIVTFSEQLEVGDIISINYQLEHIKIGALDFTDGEPSLYGIRVKNLNGETVFETNDDGNLTVTGTINATDGIFRGTVYATDGEFNGHISATSGEFKGYISVGDSYERYIIIDGAGDQPYIASSDYVNDETKGWLITGEGDAIFNNVSVRGAIKTSVFEYSEIQAVGGAFLFRPSAVIKKAEIITTKLKDGDGTITSSSDLVLTLDEKDRGFYHVGDWCKLSNYTEQIATPDGLENTGLSNVFKVKEVLEDGRVILEGAAALFE